MKKRITSIIIHITGAAVFAVSVLSALTAGPAVASTSLVLAALVGWGLAAIAAWELRPSFREENPICPAARQRQRVRALVRARIPALVEFSTSNGRGQAA